MPEVLALLEQANAYRSSAERARRLADCLTTPSVVEELDRHAADLEGRAWALEERASAIAATGGAGGHAGPAPLPPEAEAGLSERWAGLG
ncbi:MAG TPA: hypothetical protein VN668_06155 [Stellaceae bacterium]|nr:hypothetical protein [Stellaceae bacterium]